MSWPSLISSTSTTSAGDANRPLGQSGLTAVTVHIPDNAATACVSTVSWMDQSSTVL